MRERAGFFEDVGFAGLPMPVPHPTPCDKQAEFLTALAQKEAEMLASGGGVRAYFGAAVCRLCGIQDGDREFSTPQWVWPEGFKHYVAVHNVRPPRKFIEFLLWPPMSAEEYALEIEHDT